jgi:hypothetical protein
VANSYTTSTRHSSETPLQLAQGDPTDARKTALQQDLSLLQRDRTRFPDGEDCIGAQISDAHGIGSSEAW